MSDTSGPCVHEDGRAYQLSATDVAVLMKHGCIKSCDHGCDSDTYHASFGVLLHLGAYAEGVTVESYGKLIDKLYAMFDEMLGREPA